MQQAQEESFALRSKNATIEKALSDFLWAPVPACDINAAVF